MSIKIDVFPLSQFIILPHISLGEACVFPISLAKSAFYAEGRETLIDEKKIIYIASVWLISFHYALYGKRKIEDKGTFHLQYYSNTVLLAE